MNGRKLLCAALSAFFIRAAAIPASCEAPASAGPEGPETAAAADASMDWFEEKGLTLGESSVAYPALRENTVSGELRETVNSRILEDGGIRDYVTRVSQLISGGKLKVSWRGCVLGPVFSFAVSAEGAVATPRNTFVWTGGNIDLRDGREIGWDDLFTAPDEALKAVEAYLEDEVEPELSAYLLNSRTLPVPELFRITERGVILMYPVDQLCTLSDRAGDILIPWSVTEPWLNRAEDGVPAAAGVTDWLEPAADAPEEEIQRNAERIRAAVADGSVPGIPVKLGDSLQALTDEWRLLIDPDVYLLGRMFSLEGACFRGVFLTTDFLSESWENSVVDGIRADLGSLYGLTVGKTTREAWIRALGEPEYTAELDEEQAESYRTVPGNRDYYSFGGRRLVLQADSDGVLASFILSE